MLFFDRKAELITESGYKFRNWEGVGFNFKYTTMDQTGLPVLEIELSNLDRDLRNSIQEEQAIFNIGYGTDLGDLTSGDIKNIEHNNNVVSFEVIGDSDNFKGNYNTWYTRQVTAQYIVDDIANTLGFKIKNSSYLKSDRLPNGWSIKGPGINSIKSLASKFGYGVTTRGLYLEVYKKDSSGDVGSILLKPGSGLINVNKYKNEDEKYDYIVEALPVPSIAQGDIIKVEHDNLNGAVKIIDYEIYGRKTWKAYYYAKVVG